ncbi:hypothetical protein [Lacinutrix undariae]
MITVIATSLFIVCFLIIAFYAKKHLYVYEHEKSIKKELAIFDENLNKIDALNLKSNYNIGSGHLYENHK